MCGVVSYNDWRLMERSKQPKPAKHATINPNVSEPDDKSKNENGGEIEVSLRHALIWSLIAHGAVVSMMAIDRLGAGDEATRPFAIRLASTIIPASRNALPGPVEPGSTRPPKLLSAAEPQRLPLPVIDTTTHVLPTIDRRIEQTDSSHADTSPTVQVPAQVRASTQAGALNAEGLRGYRLALAREARRVWRYPPQAVAAGWQGTTEIRLELLANGQLLAAHVEKSSGHALLDDAARAMIVSAASTTQIPPGLTGNSSSAFAVVVPVKFSLANRDEGKSSQSD